MSLYTGSLLSFASVTFFGTVQAVTSLQGIIFGVSANDINDFSALDDIVLRSAITGLCSLLFFIRNRRKPRPTVNILIFLLFLGSFWIVFINKLIFEEREAAWSTFTNQEIWATLIFRSAIPIIICCAAQGFIFRKMLTDRPNFFNRPLL